MRHLIKHLLVFILIIFPLLVYAQQYPSEFSGSFLSNDKKDTLFYTLIPRTKNQSILTDTLIFFRTSNTINNNRFKGTIKVKVLNKNKISVGINLNLNWKTRSEFKDIYTALVFVYNPTKGTLTPIGIDKKYKMSIEPYNIPNAKVEVLKFLLNNYLEY